MLIVMTSCSLSGETATSSVKARGSGKKEGVVDLAAPRVSEKM